MIIKLTLYKTHALAPADAGWLMQKGYGEKTEGGVILMPEEAAYLISRGKAVPLTPTGRKIDPKRIDRVYANLDAWHARKHAYAHLRDQGFIVKSGAKYGVHYRIYAKGEKPGQAHSTWLAHVVNENERISMRTLAAWIRLAHSVRKTFWLIMHTEGDIVIYSMDWEKTFRKKTEV